MSNGDDVLDNWEEIDEAGLCMTLQTKLQTANTNKPASAVPVDLTASKMKLLQRPQSLQENSSSSSAGGSSSSSSSGGGSSAAAALSASSKQIMIAKKPSDADLTTAPVVMVLHKSGSEYDAVNYATPINNQTVKILRRPAQSEERRDTNGIRPKQPIKTLQQREQEYAQARLRILGSAKNPEDDKPATPTTPASTAPVNQSTAQTEPPPAAVSFNNLINNNGNSNNNGMHRSSSAPKMQSAPMYNNYNNYYQPAQSPAAAAAAAAAMGYFYQQQQHQQQQLLPPYNQQRMPQYVSGAAGAPQSANPQQSWSPVVGGSVSAALLRQQSMQHQQQQQQHQQQQQQQHQQQQQQQQAQYAHPYNDSILRLPRGPCPNGTVGFQMRR
ncbi:hypothetical protein KR222_008373 [Zaprionus bogoriensis]|nr:hypothetical protein KR222_008373 [Zaprionus bogoriensis]